MIYPHTDWSGIGSTPSTEPPSTEPPLNSPPSVLEPLSPTSSHLNPNVFPLTDTVAASPVHDAPYSKPAFEVSVQSIDHLEATEIRRWESIRRTRPEFRSPFFSVAFCQAVQRARGDVSVVVVRDGQTIVGFLPLHRQGRKAFPAGRFFNDAQNLIATEENLIPWHWLLRAAGLRSFEFHALTGADESTFPEHTCHDTIQSFRCEIGDDSQKYLARLGKEHKTIGRQGQKTRKLAREIGPVSLEMDCRDPQILRQTIQWKRDQYRRTHILDLFSKPWTMRLMDELFDRPTDSAETRGILSVLRAGDQIVAAHYGMIEGSLLHYWFPAYAPAFSRYSPGTGLFCSILDAATEHGIECVDMGYGEQPYKLKQTDATGSVHNGCIAKSRFYRTWRCAQAHAVRSMKQMPGKEPAKRVWRTIFPNAGISKIG